MNDLKFNIDENKCIHCGECVVTCQTGAHKIIDGMHVFDREQCMACGECAKKCFGEALTYYGREVSIEELLPLLLEDKDFYDASGGGVTLSGGECLCQADFCAKLLRALKENGVNTAIDTCGMVSREALDKVIPFTDNFLYDIKAIDEGVHVKCTGHSNKLILENIAYLDSIGKEIEVRIPYVPDYNNDQMEKIAVFLKQLKNVKKVKVLPYHNYAGSKYKALGIENILPERLPTVEEIVEAENYFSVSSSISGKK